MKEGDLVRFVKLEELPSSRHLWCTIDKLHIGMLVKHDKLMSTCYILYEGSIIKMRAELVEKAGRKDLERAL